MNCAACGHANPERAKFCLEDGSPFAARCGSCGLELPPAAKFCLECGTRVGATPAAAARPPEPAGERADRLPQWETRAPINALTASAMPSTLRWNIGKMRSTNRIVW